MAEALLQIRGHLRISLTDLVNPENLEDVTELRTLRSELSLVTQFHSWHVLIKEKTDLPSARDIALISRLRQRL
jgi:hypothetical protein